MKNDCRRLQIIYQINLPAQCEVGIRKDVEQNEISYRMLQKCVGSMNSHSWNEEVKGTMDEENKGGSWHMTPIETRS